MSLRANLLHPIGLILATTGGLATVAAVGVAGWAVANGTFAALICSAFLLVPGLPLAYLGVRIRNRAARDSTIFQDEEVVTYTTKTVGGPFPPPRRPPHPDDDF